jgi:hypothetical protein
MLMEAFTRSNESAKHSQSGGVPCVDSPVE